MEENDNLEQKEEKETNTTEESHSIVSEESSSVENNTVADTSNEEAESAISATEKKEVIDENSEDNCEIVVEEESEEDVEAKIVEEVKAAAEMEYAEINGIKVADEDFFKEAEIEKSENKIVADEVSEPVSSKPQAVIDELDKLKTASHEVTLSVVSSNSFTAIEGTPTVADTSQQGVISPNYQSLQDNSSFNEVSSFVVTSDSSSINDSSSSVATSDRSPINDGSSSVTTSDNSSVKEEVSSSEASDGSTLEVETPLASKEEPSNELSLKHYFNADFWKSFFFDIVFLAFCFFFTFVLVQKWFFSQEAKIIGMNQIHSSLESGEKTTIGNINVLVMGIDSVEGTHRSDTIFVLGVNPSKGKITMLSIPRDTRVIIENKARKINEILPRYGEPTLRKILEDLLKISISRKVEVGFESFIGVVDAIGGVDINIEKPMHYDDNWGNLHIHFNPGMNHLDGQDALRYVRFRKDAMADLGRIKRQQEFVKAIVLKLMSPTSIVRLPSIIEKSFSHIKTDFTLQEVLTLAKGFNTTDVKFRTMSIPGEARYIDKISYFMPYSEEAISIGNNYFSDLAIFELEKNYEADRVMPVVSKSDRKNK